MTSIGGTIQAERERHNITRVELARRVGMTSQGLWKIETGKSDPRLSTLRHISTALNIHFSITPESWT